MDDVIRKTPCTILKEIGHIYVDVNRVFVLNTLDKGWTTPRVQLEIGIEGITNGDFRIGCHKLIFSLYTTSNG